MRKIKVLAILLAMTLTISMFATAASAADVEFLKNSDVSIASAALTDYSRADFQKNLSNAKYAALFDFDGHVSSTENSIKPAAGYSLESSITEAPNNEKCVLSLTPSTEGKIFIYDYHDLGVTDLCSSFASNDDCMTINGGYNVTLTFNELDDLKPVAVGYFVTAHKDSASVDMTNNVTIDLSVGADATDTWTSSGTTRLLRFYGYKAPVGDYIKSINISNAGGGHMRVDDLCVIYEKAQNVEAGVRFHKGSDSEYVDIYSVKSLVKDDALNATVSADKGNGNKILLVGYNKDNLLWFVRSATTENPLNVSKYLSQSNVDNITTWKVFIWNKDTLVPVGVNATLD